MSKKKDMVQAIKDAPTKAVRVLPNSERLQQRSYGLIDKLLTQLEVKADSGAELSKDDIAMFRQVQQALTDLRKDDREQFKAGADENLSDEEVIALLEAKGISLDTKGTKGDT